MNELPPDSPYRLTVGDSLFSSLRQLWRASGQSGSTKLPATAG